MVFNGCVEYFEGEVVGGFEVFLFFIGEFVFNVFYFIFVFFFWFQKVFFNYFVQDCVEVVVVGFLEVYCEFFEFFQDFIVVGFFFKVDDD